MELISPICPEFSLVSCGLSPRHGWGEEVTWKWGRRVVNGWIGQGVKGKTVRIEAVGASGGTPLCMCL